MASTPRYTARADRYAERNILVSRGASVLGYAIAVHLTADATRFADADRS
jgi:hypothetical protein